jgi:hypothetical protein
MTVGIRPAALDSVFAALNRVAVGALISTAAFDAIVKTDHFQIIRFLGI